MKRVIYYEAFDGTKFEDWLECFIYELNKEPLKPLEFGFELADITEPGTWMWQFDINKNRKAFVKVEESK